jgi:hypothetical protein
MGYADSEEEPSSGGSTRFDKVAMAATNSAGSIGFAKCM